MPTLFVGAVLVSAGVFFVGYIAQRITQKESSDEPIDVDKFVESLRPFEDNEALRREERQTLYYDEFRLPPRTARLSLHGGGFPPSPKTTLAPLGPGGRPRKKLS